MPCRVLLIYLLMVVLAAIGFGVSAGMTAALLAFLAYNFFFIAPVHTFTIAEQQDLFVLLVFFTVALVTGQLAGRMREVADSSQRHATSLQSLTDFAATLSGSQSLDEIVGVLAAQAAATAKGSVVVMLRAGDSLELRLRVPGDQVLEPSDWQAAERAVRSGETTTAAAPGWPGARYEFRPLLSAAGTIGAIGLLYNNGQRSAAAVDESTLQTILRHSVIAIERTRLKSETAAAHEETEQERMRSALLSSISHDLRTPLASILGAVTSLRQLGTSMPAETRADLLEAIEEETRRLSQFVANLLDMTRLDTEMIDLQKTWLDAGDAAHIAVTRAKKLFPGFVITFSAAPGLSQIKGDATLFEHVVFNLIENAVKFSKPDQPIAVALYEHNRSLHLTVSDHGRGIPKDALEHVFEKFFRGRDGELNVPGTGLGLTICKRIAEAMGGSIMAQSPIESGQGTRISAQFPIPDAAPGHDVKKVRQI
jgi:two-component system, OmpR family, sensor histidine kinase KdpD